ncbi:MAG TPA: hypothetical protein VGR89_03205 [Puia sp.]|nr:hypothetical protein [Puia sp.]
MSLIQYYSSQCGIASNHSCDPCAALEAARVRSVAIISVDWAFSDPTDPAEWHAGIEAGMIVIIPETSGDFDGGTAKTITGFGDTPEQNLTYNFKLTYRDPNYSGNAPFYNSLMFNRNWLVAFRSDTLLHIADKPAVFKPKAQIPDDPQGIVIWEVECNWISKILPAPVQIPAGIFSCFTVE